MGFRVQGIVVSILCSIIPIYPPVEPRLHIDLKSERLDLDVKAEA